MLLWFLASGRSCSKCLLATIEEMRMESWTYGGSIAGLTSWKELLRALSWSMALREICCCARDMRCASKLI